jgi:nitrogen regulatory protein P-II 1
MAGLRAAGASGATVTLVKGLGRQGGHVDVYRGREYLIELVPKLRLEVLADEDVLEAVIDAIVARAGTGKIGDGKLWVGSLGSVQRIRTGEGGAAAL